MSEAKEQTWYCQVCDDVEVTSTKVYTISHKHETSIKMLSPMSTTAYREWVVENKEKFTVKKKSIITPEVKRINKERRESRRIR